VCGSSSGRPRQNPLPRHVPILEQAPGPGAVHHLRSPRSEVRSRGVGVAAVWRPESRCCFCKRAWPRPRDGCRQTTAGWRTPQNESGRLEVDVQPFPATGSKWQISPNGGSHPRRRRDGKELYVAADTKFFAVAVKTASTFEAGIPQPLFETRFASSMGSASVDPRRYDTGFELVELICDSDFALTDASRIPHYFCGPVRHNGLTRPPAFLYSARSALTTSTRDARAAGVSDATIAASTSTVAAPTIGTAPGI
jgi:hypothetical protein